MNKAILIVSFGTTSEEAIGSSILPLEQDAAAALSDWTVLRCFTSGMVISRLARKGIIVPSLTETLTKLVREGILQVVVLPTLLADGGEYQKILDICGSFRPSFACLQVGKPLLSDAADFDTVADFLQSAFPLQEKEVLVLMGHGVTNSDNSELRTLGNLLRQRDSRFFLAALNGEPDFSRILQEILKTNCRRVILAPLMLTAGTHAVQHLSGPEEGSWLNRCKAAGLDVQCRLMGLGEAPEIRRLYLRHLSDCFTEK